MPEINGFATTNVDNQTIIVNGSGQIEVQLDNTTLEYDATNKVQVKSGILPTTLSGTGATGSINIPATAKKIIITGSHSTNLTLTIGNATAYSTRVLYTDAGAFSTYATYRFDATGDFISEHIISSHGLIMGGWVLSTTQNRFGHLSAVCSARPTTLSFTADNWEITFEY